MPKPAPSSRRRVSAVFLTTASATGWAWTSTRPRGSARNRPMSSSPGMVITVEPGIYLPDWGGIRIEDDVLVTPDGCEVLSRVPKSLDSVRID